MTVVLVGDGSRIVHLDPWLPNDHSYEIGAPLGGRFQAQSLSAAASTTFVMNEYGDMYTRLFDFDVSGADTLFFQYSWADQSGLRAPDNHFGGLLEPGIAKIQLPAPSWEHQPKIPGEGRQDGQNGYWHKMIRDNAWSFTPTGQELGAERIDNPAQDRSGDTLSAPSPYHYSVDLPDRGDARGYRLEVTSFEWATSVREATVIAADGARLPVDLHTIDPLRMTPRGPGLDETPRNMLGAVGLSDQVWEQRESDPAVRAFIDGWLDGAQIAPVGVDVTETTMAIHRQDP